MPLTDVRARNAKPGSRPFKLPDGQGLHLYVTPAGTKSWRFRYERTGKEKLITLGAYPAMSLREARDRRDDLRRNMRGGGDPAPKPAPATPSLDAIVKKWHDVQKGRWKPHHAADVLDSIEREIPAPLRARPITEIAAADLLDALRPVEARGAVETAHRVRQRLEGVWAFAIASGDARDNPAAGILAAMAPMPPKGRRPALLDLEAARAMLRAVEATQALPITHLAMRLLALTVARPGEARATRWPEYEDLDGTTPLWRVPAVRMKAHRDYFAEEHMVPLSRQAVETIAAARVLTGQMPFVFPSRNAAHKPMSENALGYLLNRAGYYGRHVPHGWRATFSTLMNGRYRADRAVIDLMLAHVPKDKVEAAYNRAEHMERRRELAQIWADLLMEGMPPPSTLIGAP